jgi:hypothetical protein
VDGWNAWFQSDRKKLAEWKCQNRQSLAHLWIGFLSFYAGFHVPYLFFKLENKINPD